MNFLRKLFNKPENESSNANTNKTYKNEVLWPFFKIRIPGLKQPLVQEIISTENINANDEASLLKKFGEKNTSNPYILKTV